MNGRIYDPVLGQFMQPDNFIQGSEDYLGYDRYTYCRGNPFKFTDPSGEDPAIVTGDDGLDYEITIGKISFWYIPEEEDNSWRWLLRFNPTEVDNTYFMQGSSFMPETGGGGNGTAGVCVGKTMERVAQGMIKDGVALYVETGDVTAGSYDRGSGPTFNPDNYNMPNHELRQGELPPNYDGVLGTLRFLNDLTTPEPTYYYTPDGKHRYQMIIGVVPDIIGGPARKAKDIIRVGDLLVNSKVYHPKKAKLLMQIGKANFKHLVGENPDFYVKNNQVFLQPAKNSPFFGRKSYLTNLSVNDFINYISK